MKRSRAKRKDVSPPTSSMGDIAFLLIIFFMLVSNFVKESSIELKPPESEVIDELEETQISVSMDKDARIYLNGAEVESADSLETQLTSALQDKETPKGRTVMFNCDEAVDKRDFERVIEAIAQAGGRIAAVGKKIESQGQ